MGESIKAGFHVSGCGFQVSSFKFQQTDRDQNSLDLNPSVTVQSTKLKVHASSLKTYVTNDLLCAIVVTVYSNNRILAFTRPLMPVRGHAGIVRKHHLKIAELIP